MNALLAQERKTVFVRKEGKKMGRGAGHHIETQHKEIIGVQEHICDIHIGTPTTRESNIARYEYPENTEINEAVNECDIGSIS